MQEKNSIKVKNSLKPVLPIGTLTTSDDDEFLLIKEEDSTHLFSIQHTDIWQLYKTQQATIWNTNQINFLTIENIKFSDNEIYYLKYLLSFLASNNTTESKKITLRFLSELQCTEAQFFYAIQLMKENIHTETHSLLIDAYIKDPKEKIFIHNAIKTFSAIRKKEAWASKWIDNGSFAERLAASAIALGVFCSGSYCSIYWMTKKWSKSALSSSIELIYRDKKLHKDFACLLYNSHLNNPLSSEKMAEIIGQAIDIETEFTTASLPVKLIGMKSNLMTQYIQYIADTLMIQLGYDSIYNVANPFGFMDMFAFSEKLGIEYQKVGVVNKLHEITPEFKLTEKF